MFREQHWGFCEKFSDKDLLTDNYYSIVTYPENRKKDVPIGFSIFK